MEPYTEVTLTKYQTRDGVQHDTPQAAEEHQVREDLAERLQEQFAFRASDMASASEIAAFMLANYKVTPK